MIASGSPDNGVLVVGAGYVGQRVLAGLETGEAVGLSRAAISASQPVVVFDLDAAAPLLIGLPDKYRVLYTVPPSADAEADIRLERLLGGLHPAPENFVYISTTGVYGDCDGALVNEETEPQPATARARRRLAAETALQTWASTEGVRLCILRTPGIYGPQRLGIERIRTGSLIIRDADANPGNRIHVDDLVTCCMATLFDDRSIGLCNIADGDFRTSTWFTQEVARQCGLAPLAEISREQANRHCSARRLSFQSESRRIDTQKMREQLGITPGYANAEDGIRASLAETQTSV